MLSRQGTADDKISVSVVRNDIKLQLNSVSVRPVACEVRSDEAPLCPIVRGASKPNTDANIQVTADEGSVGQHDSELTVIVDEATGIKINEANTVSKCHRRCNGAGTCIPNIRGSGKRYGCRRKFRASGSQEHYDVECLGKPAQKSKRTSRC